MVIQEGKKMEPEPHLFTTASKKGRDLQIKARLLW